MTSCPIAYRDELNIVRLANPDMTSLFWKLWCEFNWFLYHFNIGQLHTDDITIRVEVPSNNNLYFTNPGSHKK